MLASSTPFQVMVEGQEQTLAWSLTMALPGGVYPDASLAVADVQIDLSTVTDVPAGTRLLEGYSSVEATFTLSGLVDQTDETKTAGWLFGPYSTTSPLYHSDAFRAAVTIQLGLYPASAGGTPELLAKFTGYVDTYNVDQDGNVAFTCIDLRSNFRSTLALPAVVTAPPFNAGLTSEFAVDAILRAVTAGAVSSWPAQRAKCALAAGMRTSLWPDHGSMNPAVTVTRPVASGFAAGKFGSGVNATEWASSVGYTPSHVVGANQGVFIEYWAMQNAGPLVTVSDGPNNSVFNVGFQVELFGGVTPRLVATVYGSAGSVGTYSYNLPGGSDSAVHYFGVLIAWSGTSWSVQIFYDATTANSGALTASASRSATASCTDVTLSFFPFSAGGTFEAFQITTESSPISNTAFVPQAVLDPSLNPLQLVPAVSGDPWQAIQAIAAAELAVAGFDESGVFRFQNRATIRGKTSARNVTSTTSLKTLGVSESAAAVVNRCQVGWTGWTYATSPSTVYNATAVIKVAKHSTQVVKTTLDAFAVQLDSSLSNLPNSSTDTTHSFYRASQDSAGIAEHPGGLTFTVTQAGADSLTITIVNPTIYDAWLITPSNYTDLPVGTPVLRVAGTQVTANNEITDDFQWPPASAGGAASSRFGEVLYQLTGNPWIQDDATAAQLAQDIVIDSYLPRPDLTNVGIIPDPRLQLSDVVHIQDPDRTGVDEYARIFATTITWQAPSAPGEPASYDQTIDARTLASPGGWIMGYPGRSEVGSTAYVYS